MQKVIVIGTNHAGTHAVSTITSNYSDVEVVTYDKNDNISFLGCGMALWISNVIDNGDGLFYSNPETLENGGATVYMEHELKDVDFDNKTVSVTNLKTGDIKVDSYDKLILAVGSWPILPKLPGYELENIMYAKIYQNAQATIDKLKDESIKEVVVIGAGYIGIELAESFIHNGRKVTLVNNMNVLNRYYDEVFQDAMAKRLSDSGVVVVTDELVTAFDGVDGKVSKVITDKSEYDAQLVLMSVGFAPNTKMLNSDKLKMLPNGAILTNNRMETSVEDVYAIGDCCTVQNNATGVQQHIALATNAVRTGIVAAHNAMGTDIEMLGVQGSNAIHIFGLTMCSTGITETVALEMGMNVGSVTVTDQLRPDFMPDNCDVTLKVVWDKDTRAIVGAQIMSDEDVTLALNMFSVCIQEKMSIDKLALVDIFFLPHFNKPHNFITKAGLEALGK